MSYKLPTAMAALLLIATSSSVHAGSAKEAFVLTGAGKVLVKINDMSKPDQTDRLELSANIDALAYRPVSDELIGFSRSGAIYSIDQDSGDMTDLGARFSEDATIKGDAVAFDFNNKIDAVRAVGSDGTNLVYFPNNFADERAGNVKRFTDTFYAPGDVNEGKEPAIFANAYTNAISGKKAESTFQYALDSNTNSLVSLDNNAGELKTVGEVTVDGKPVDLASAGGFDITSQSEGQNDAYAILQLADEEDAKLYKIDLTTAEADLIADFAASDVTGFAVLLKN